MAIQIQLRRGTTYENDLFKGQPGEITMDTQKKNFRIHDNVRTGGYVIPADADVVHKTGNVTETIDGVKTFNNSDVGIKSTTIDWATIPTDGKDRYSGVTIYDINGKRIGKLEQYQIKDTGEIRLGLNVSGYDANNNIKYSPVLGVSINKDGTGGKAYTSSPGTNSTTSATNIATVGWANTAGVDSSGNNVNNIVHKSGDETISGSKTFSAITKHNHEVVGASIGTGAYCQFRAISGNYGFMIRNDGSDTCFLLTASGAQYGTWNNFRPLTINNASGNVTCGTSWTFSQDIQGTATKAKWADLAENYQSDEKYPAGTLIQFGGEKDITIARFGENCNGVISERPGFLLDNELEDGLPVALSGKTPVRVIGKVNRFDRLVLSSVSGVATVKTSDDERVIAIALEASDNEEEKLVKCVTKFNLD